MTDIAADYVRTLAAWRSAFLGRLDEVRALGFDDRFIRMWDYYLALSEAGFATGLSQDLQIVLEKTRGSGRAARRLNRAGRTRASAVTPADDIDRHGGEEHHASRRVLPTWLTPRGSGEVARPHAGG